MSTYEPEGNEPTKEELLIKRCENLERELAHLREEHRHFIHTLAHDVRGCFNSILGYAQLLKEVYNPNYVDTIVESVFRMTRLLDRSVRLVDIGETVGLMVEIDLNSLVRNLAESLIPSEIQFVSGKLPKVIGDPDRLAQAFQNIILNAIEHGKPTKIEVFIASADSSVNLLFRNNGHPIPEYLRDKILVDRISSKEGGGLGLITAKRIIEAHCWTIHLDTRPYTTFRVNIPHSGVVSQSHQEF